MIKICLIPPLYSSDQNFQISEIHQYFQDLWIENPGDWCIMTHTGLNWQLQESDKFVILILIDWSITLRLDHLE